MNNPLSKVGEKRLATFEVVIEKGLGTFIEIGGALQAIRNERLYRANHESFDEYLRVRWRMSRTYAHRIIEATAIAELLPMGNKPESERQARELAPLKDDPEAMAEVMEAAHAATDGKPTAAAIAEEVEKRTTYQEAVAEHTASAHPALDLVCKFDKGRNAFFQKVTTFDPAEVVDAYVDEGQRERVDEFIREIRNYAMRLETRLRERTKLMGVQ